MLAALLQAAAGTPSSFPTPPRDTETAIALVVLLLGMVVIGIALVKAALRRKERRTRATRALADMGQRPLYCFCGQPAERPASRTGEPTWLDDIFPAWRRVSLAAQYKPAIPSDGVPTLCTLHGRLWDTKLKKKVVEVVELALAELHQQIAFAMAQYEGGDLAAELEKSSLSDAQKKAKTLLDKQRTKPSGVETAVIVSPAAFNPGGVGPDPVMDGVPAAMAAAAASAQTLSQSPVPSTPLSTVRPGPSESM